jgi:hypothetical protein
MLLVEGAVSLGILTVLGLILLKLSLNILTPRQWGLQQTLSDAYMTYERAYAQRLPFDELVSHASPFPIHPAKSSADVEIGRLPGGQIITGTIHRIRIPDPGNLPLDGGNGTLQTNMRVWQIQSILTYSVAGREYAKSRTVIRTQ